MENKYIEDNLVHDGLSDDAFKDNNVKRNKMKAILNKESQVTKAYFLYYSVSKL